MQFKEHKTTIHVQKKDKIHINLKIDTQPLGTSPKIFLWMRQMVWLYISKKKKICKKEIVKKSLYHELA